MKAALIPSRGYERTALESDIHLVLPLEECVKNRDYVNTYLSAKARGHYIILDNGCAEGRLVEGRELVKFAIEIGAHEIVAPDIMSDGPGTVEATLGWLKEYASIVDDYNIMGVVQGADTSEWKHTLEVFAGTDAITTIGIPKVHVKSHSLRKRYEIVQYVLAMYPKRFKIHLLGLNERFPTEILELPWPKEVRSMDSAQPYKLAEEGLLMTTERAWANRREEYFAQQVPAEAHILNANINTFIAWAKRHERRGH